MPAGDEVDSFIILPPSGARSQSALRGGSRHPEELFSRIRFYCQRRHFAFDDDYQVLPICGMGGDEPGTLRVLDYPKQSVMMGIAAAL
ncbi:hypothetical protein NKH45_08365 [Mesorhizobium sp. M1156]|uniref:hypothetical protein n=1 Tax=Mesorhizobium sp. M1156 TaxID=2957064 RepID=UPI00333BC0CA